MTIDEAMTDLSIQREVKRRLGKNREADALGLGMEALEFLQTCRNTGCPISKIQLPGETKD